MKEHLSTIHTCQHLRYRPFAWFITLLLGVTLSAPSLAAIDMFLVLDGIDGESQDSIYQNTIDVLAFSEGMTQSGSTHTGTGGSTGKVNIADISITKYLDASSVPIRQRIASGQTIQEGRIVVRTAGAVQREIFVIILKNILVTSVSLGGGGTEDRLIENIKLNFAEVRWIYKLPDTSGTGGGTIEAGWNIVANTPL